MPAQKGTARNSWPPRHCQTSPLPPRSSRAPQEKSTRWPQTATVTYGWEYTSRAWCWYLSKTGYSSHTAVFPALRIPSGRDAWWPYATQAHTTHGWAATTKGYMSSTAIWGAWGMSRFHPQQCACCQTPRGDFGPAHSTQDCSSYLLKALPSPWGDWRDARSTVWVKTLPAGYISGPSGKGCSGSTLTAEKSRKSPPKGACTKTPTNRWTGSTICLCVRTEIYGSPTTEA